MTLQELITELRNQIGDNDTQDPNITDSELTTILNNSAKEYSRIKGIVDFYEAPYNKDENIYELPTDSYRVKSVELKNEHYYKINFIDNLTQIILENQPYVTSDTLKITYVKYFSPNEIDEREIDIYLLLAESLCFKLMASKTADYIKFNTGEKMIDESGISKKYLELYDNTFKKFKKRINKAYGRRVNNIKTDLDYLLPYPPKGETP